MCYNIIVPKKNIAPCPKRKTPPNSGERY